MLTMSCGTFWSQILPGAMMCSLHLLMIWLDTLVSRVVIRSLLL